MTDSDATRGDVDGTTSTLLDVQRRAHSEDGVVSRLARLIYGLFWFILRPVLSRMPVNRATMWLSAMIDPFARLQWATGVVREPIELPGFRAELVRPKGSHSLISDGVILYLHGGGFALGGLGTHRGVVARHARRSGLPVLHIAYRQLPHTPIDGSIEDCLTAYRWLLNHGGTADKIVFGGDSAGGFLVFATALRAIERGLPAPAGIFGCSGVYDLTCESKVAHRNATRDPFVPVTLIEKLFTLGAAPHTPAECGLSPVDSHLLGKLPPALIVVGGSEVLRPDSELLAQRLAAAGVPCTLQIWRGQVHAFPQVFPFLPESAAVLDDITCFVAARIAAGDQRQQGSGIGGHARRFDD